MRYRNRTGPLRKIVDYDEAGREILECGHHQFPVQDIAGPTNADRRRCWQCGRKGITDAVTEEFAESLEKLCEVLQLAESDVCEAAKLANPIAELPMTEILSAIGQVRGMAGRLSRAVKHDLRRTKNQT